MADQLFSIQKRDGRRKNLVPNPEKCYLLSSEEAPWMLKRWYGSYENKEFPWHTFQFNLNVWKSQFISFTRNYYSELDDRPFHLKPFYDSVTY